MNLRMGSQVFENVQIPLLWGTRAIILDSKQGLAVIDLADDSVKIEILASKPAQGIEYRPVETGYEILNNGDGVYTFDPNTYTLSMLNQELPDCTIETNKIVVGMSEFSNNVVHGFGVGIAVDYNGGVAMGAPIPKGLSELII